LIDVRTLLFANAVVFAVLAVAVILVWRGNRKVAGLAALARVHVTMVPGTVLIGLKPGVVPALLSAVGGNALVILSVVWLHEGIRGLYGRTRETWPRVVLLLWGALLLFFLYTAPSLRARILTTSLVEVGLVLRAGWTARYGLGRPGEKAPSLVILGSLGLLGIVFTVRCVFLAGFAQVVQPVGSDAPTIAMVTASLIAGTGWTLGVMNLVYARLNAEARRYEAGLEQLVQVAAHELRTPLTSILGMLKLLSVQPSLVSGEDRERLLEIALRSSERMARLIDDLLDLERIESGQASFDLESVELDRLVEQARELTEGHARRLDVTVELALLPQARVRADPQRLLRVLVNLLSNAVKFSPRGESVRLSVARANGSIRVEVQDHGPGIPEELRGRVFQRFARGTAAGVPQSEGKGTGLGLAISKALVEGMGGRIGFETQDQVGTTFYCELPEARSEDAER
jgi:signal transduction histidine kinase